MSLTHTYRICDLVLASNIPLPELTAATVFAIGCDCRFELLPPGNPSSGNFTWFHHWTIQEDNAEVDAEDNDEGGGKEAWTHFARTPDGYLLRFPSCGDFFLSADTVQCRPLPRIPEVTVRHLLLDQVIPLFLSRRDSIVLHASAVLTDHGVIAFVGKSGQGKSTLAASFAQKGCALVSDDCLVLREQHGNWIAFPSYPGVRMWPSTAEQLIGKDPDTADVAHYTVKRRICDTDLIPFANSQAPIKRLFFLADETSTVSIQRLAPGRAFVSLVESAYNVDIQDAAFLRRQFEAVGQLTENVPAYAIQYPHEFASLPAVWETVVHHLEEAQDRDVEGYPARPR
jgi:hypothetical protein